MPISTRISRGASIGIIVWLIAGSLLSGRISVSFASPATTRGGEFNSASIVDQLRATMNGGALFKPPFDQEIIVPTCLVETTGDNLTDYASSDASALQTAAWAASPGDLIKVSGLCAGVQTINNESQTLSITESVHIQGGYTTAWLEAPDPGGTPTILNAAENGRVISISGPITVTLDGLELINGLASEGAAVRSINGASISILRSRVAHNTASERGGAIANYQGNLSVATSSFFDNAAQDGTIFNSASATATIIASSFYTNTVTRGGGLYNDENGTAIVENTSFAYNSANEGGGIHNRGVITATHNTFAYNSAGFGTAIHTWNGSMALFNNIMGLNSTGGLRKDCLNEGVLTASSGNLIADGTCSASISGNPGLAALGDYGGDTLSIALLPASPAIDQADSAACLASDQRSISRPQGSECDIGAYEAVQQPLAITLSGAGSGVVLSTPAGIVCGITCTATFPAGATVTLTPTAGIGSTFTGWSGACSGTVPCAVTIDQATAITATFEVQQHTLSVTLDGTGAGTVQSDPAGIACGNDCSEVYAYGTSITLTATPTAGSTFSGWSGACSGTAPCVVTIEAAAQLTATFTGAAPHWTLFIPIIRRP